MGFTTLVDSREKDPLDLVDGEYCIASEVVALKTGDYTIKELPEDFLYIERKNSVSELYAWMTRNRDRFDAQLNRVRNFKYKILVIECDIEDVFNIEGYWWIKFENKRQQYTIRRRAINIIKSNIASLALRHGLSVFFVGKNRDRSKELILALMDKAWKIYQESLPKE